MQNKKNIELQVAQMLLHHKAPSYVRIKNLNWYEVTCWLFTRPVWVDWFATFKADKSSQWSENYLNHAMQTASKYTALSCNSLHAVGLYGAEASVSINNALLSRASVI